MSAPLHWWKLLPLNSMHCPDDKTPLHWEVLGAMRVRRSAGAGFIYQARCPKCKKDYDVLAPKTHE